MPENSLKEFFNNCEICDPVPVSEDQSKNIKSSLQKRLAGDHPQSEKPAKEEKAMTIDQMVALLIAELKDDIVGTVSAKENVITVSFTDGEERKITVL